MAGDDGSRALAASRVARDERHRALRGREALVAEVSALLFDADPIGIAFGHNTDEYDPEAETIVLRLDTAGGPEDVRRIVHEEFTSWFGDTAGEPTRYGDVSHLVWAASQAADGS